MSAPIIYLFRHGETEWNTEGRRQGHKNSPLTSRGKPLGRAKDTAIIIANELGISTNSIIFDDRLMESSFGKWEGLTDYEVAARYPDSWKARTVDRWNTRPPSGESYADVNSRVGEWYNEVDLLLPTIVICHGLTSRVLRGIYLGLSHQEVFELKEPHVGFFKLSDGTASYIA